MAQLNVSRNVIYTGFASRWVNTPTGGWVEAPMGRGLWCSAEHVWHLLGTLKNLQTISSKTTRTKPISRSIHEVQRRLWTDCRTTSP